MARDMELGIQAMDRAGRIFEPERRSGPHMAKRRGGHSILYPASFKRGGPASFSLGVQVL